MPGYKNGWLLIKANQIVGNNKEKTIAKYSISSPGEYSIEVPKGIGYINLRVFNFTDKALLSETEIENRKGVIFSVYSGNPLEIEDKDITGVDIAFKRGFTSIPVMERYKGETVIISGEVSMLNYKKGVIEITVNNSGFGPPNVASTSIDKPGQYSIKVPKNYGNIYIGAFNTLSNEPPKPDTPKGQYPGNPLKVGAKDISNINFSIE